MSDHLSVRLTTDGNGNVVDEQGHYPGVYPERSRRRESWYSISTTTKWQFTSYERDPESGLDYAIFRYDSSRLGRFMTPDPLAGTIINPQSLNRYAYVLNDPVNKIDPLGLACFWACVTARGETSCEWYCDADPFSDASQSGRGGRAPIQDQPQPAEERGPIRGQPQEGDEVTPSCGVGYSDCLANCVERNRLDNALRDIGTALGQPEIGEIAGHLPLGAAGAAILNEAANLVAGPTGRTGLGGTPSHPTTWQHKVGSKVSSPTSALPSRIGRIVGRVAHGASAVILVGEGAYNGAAIARCAAACGLDSCSNP